MLGIMLRPPASEEHRTIFEWVCAEHESISVSDGDYRVRIQQASNLPESPSVDAEDRVEKASSVLRTLVDAGL